MLNLNGYVEDCMMINYVEIKKFKKIQDFIDKVTFFKKNSIHSPLGKFCHMVIFRSFLIEKYQ